MSTTIPATPEIEADHAGKTAAPSVFVLFGAAGDLTKRKLIPALFNLVKAKLLPDNFAVIGVSVDDLGLEAFRYLVNDRRFRNHPMILETPKEGPNDEAMDAINLKVLRELVRAKS